MSSAEVGVIFFGAIFGWNLGGLFGNIAYSSTEKIGTSTYHAIPSMIFALAGGIVLWP